MFTFNPHSLARFFQIVCLQELYYQTFSFPQLNPPHFEHFCCSNCLTGSLWIIVCHFLMWSLLPFNQVCISSSFLCFEHNHICSNFHAIMTMVIHRKYFLELNNSTYIPPPVFRFLGFIVNLKNIKNNGGSWANMSLSLITRNIASQIRRLTLNFRIKFRLFFYKKNYFKFYIKKIF